MKSIINKNKTNNQVEHKVIKLGTPKLLSEYAGRFGLGYVVRNYEISTDLIPQIVDGEYSDMCDETFTTSEINKYQQTLLLTRKVEINKFSFSNDKCVQQIQN